MGQLPKIFMIEIILMNKITESAIEQFTIKFFEKSSYQYAYLSNEKLKIDNEEL